MARIQKVRKARFKEVVQLPLFPEHTPQIDSMTADTENLLAKLTECIALGYSFKFSTDAETAGVSCQMFGEVEGMTNEGLMLYGNADDWDSALAVVLFKHFFIAKGDAWSTGGQSGVKKYS